MLLLFWIALKLCQCNSLHRIPIENGLGEFARLNADVLVDHALLDAGERGQDRVVALSLLHLHRLEHGQRRNICDSRHNLRDAQPCADSVTKGHCEHSSTLLPELEWFLGFLAPIRLAQHLEMPLHRVRSVGQIFDQRFVARLVHRRHAERHCKHIPCVGR